MDALELGIVIVFRLVQYANAHSLNETTELGMEIDVTYEQL